MSKIDASIFSELRTSISSLNRQGLTHDKPPIATLHNKYAYIGLSPVLLEKLLDEIELWQAKAVIAEKAAAHFRERLEQSTASDDAQP